MDATHPELVNSNDLLLPLQRAPWQKVLYVKQDYPDSYVSSTFLAEMKKNVDIRTYDYWTVARESGCITQQLSSILIFVAVFIYSYHHLISSTAILNGTVFLSTCGYTYWEAISRRNSASYGIRYYRKKVAKTGILLFGLLYGISPILKTLTESISSDTIWALTVCLFFLNWLFYDYSNDNELGIKYTSSVSLSAAIFASVMLASRLSTKDEVFSLMALALMTFAFFPMLRRYIWWRYSLPSSAFRTLKSSLQIQNRNKSFERITNYLEILLSPPIFLTIIMVILTFVMYLRLSYAVSILYLGTVVFITFCCPWWLINIQRYKTKIYGPWDEAWIAVSPE